jgi:tetratricopeptide (TPR) repeat protein
VYNGVLKKEREAVHRQIAGVIEQLFGERLPEFYETLAYHYTQGRSVDKAVEYLMKSGEKSLARYALEESHKSFQQAYDLLRGKSELTVEDRKVLLDLLNAWAPVFHWRAQYKNLVDLFRANEELAVSLGEKAGLGMFYSWMGLGLQNLEQAKDAKQYLSKSLEIGEEIENDKIIGYACTWMSMTCSDLGLLDDALNYGIRAHEISKGIRFDSFLFMFALRAMGWAYIFKGDCRGIDNVGRSILEYGDRQSDPRALAMGHNLIGTGHYFGGNTLLAIESLKRAILVSPSLNRLSVSLAKFGGGFNSSTWAMFNASRITRTASPRSRANSWVRSLRSRVMSNPDGSWSPKWRTTGTCPASMVGIRSSTVNSRRILVLPYPLAAKSGTSYSRQVRRRTPERASFSTTTNTRHSCPIHRSMWK